jgi:hypothetical protein
MKKYLVIISAFILTTCASSNISGDSDRFEDLISAGKNVYFINQTFNRDIDFTQFDKFLISDGINQVDVISSITFVNCTFKGKVIAYKEDAEHKATITNFRNNLSFIGCSFNEQVNFKASNISGRADFTGSGFFKTTSFEDCTFFQDAFFRGTSYHEELRFQNSVFMQNVNFLTAVFDATASFQNDIFYAGAQFSNARFMGYTDFGNLTSFGNFNSNYAEFADRAIFNNSYFYRRSDINNSTFHYAEMKNCQFFGETRLNGSTVSKKFVLSETKFMKGQPDLGSFDKDKLDITSVSSVP